MHPPHRTQDYKGKSPHITHKSSNIGPKCQKSRLIPSHREFLDPPLTNTPSRAPTNAKNFEIENLKLKILNWKLKIEKEIVMGK